MGKTILVADDSRTIRRAVELTFRATDFQVVAVESADQALKSIAEIRPDLVLADASMPGTDGYALCNAIKSNASSARIPVLLLASKFDPFDQARGQEAHADGHVDKPWDTQALIDLVKSKIGLPVDTSAPQSFAQTLAKRNEKAASEPPAAPRSSSSNGQTADRAPAMAAAPASSPFGAPIERTPSRLPPPPPRPPPLSAKPTPPPVTRGAGMDGSLDDVFIEEPVDEPHVGPSLEPPPPPKRDRPKVDVWALEEQAAPDAGPPPTADQDDAIEEIAIDDVPVEEGAPTMPPMAAAPAVAKIAGAAAQPLAKAAHAAVPGVPEDQMLALAREVIERIAWEVVPELAETIIREELKRLLAEDE